MIVAKLRAARLRQRRQTGRCEGRKPFGVLPGEEAVLARIRQLYRKSRGRKRLSYGEIGAQLNAERLPTRTGRPWRAGTVRRILGRDHLRTRSRRSVRNAGADGGDDAASRFTHQ